MIVLVGWVSLTAAGNHFLNCLNDPDDHLKQCDFGDICAWNRCNCHQGKGGCRLVCQKDFTKWCDGLSEGDRCLDSNPQWECVKCGRKMTCMQNPIGPVCSHNGEVYYEDQSFMDDCNTCRCGNGIGVVMCTTQECVTP